MDAYYLILFLLIVFVSLALFTRVIPHGLTITAALALAYLLFALVGFAQFGLII